MPVFPSAPAGIQVEVIPRWPGRIVGTGGVKVTRTAGTAVVSSDIPSLVEVTPANGEGRFVQVWNEEADTNERVELKNLPTKPQSFNELTDVPETFEPIPESVQDIVAAQLAAGPGIGISYNDAAGTITISNTLPDSVLVGSGTIPGGVSAADISLPGASRTYHLKVWGLATGLQTGIVLRFSHDNGASFDAADYVYAGADYSLVGHSPFNSTSGTSLPIMGNAVDITSGRLLDIRISTARPNGGSYRGLVASGCTGSEPTNPIFHRFLWGVGPSKTSPVTNIRFVFGSPAATGAKWALYKLQEGA